MISPKVMPPIFIITLAQEFRSRCWWDDGRGWTFSPRTHLFYFIFFQRFYCYCIPCICCSFCEDKQGALLSERPSYISNTLLMIVVEKMLVLYPTMLCLRTRMYLFIIYVLCIFCSLCRNKWEVLLLEPPP